VWSVGLIALEAALGTYPFPPCRSYFELVKTIVEGPVPSEYPDVQERVPLDELQLVHACLQKAPKRASGTQLVRGRGRHFAAEAARPNRFALQQNPRAQVANPARMPHPRHLAARRSG